MARLMCLMWTATPHLLYFREAIRRMSAEHGPHVPVAAIVSGPIDLPAMILGIDGWLESLLLNKEATRRVLEMTISYSVDWINALFSDGAAFVALPVDFASPRIVTRDIAVQITVPALREALAQVTGPIFIHSGGAPLAPSVELLAGLPNVAGFVLNGGDELALARKKIGPEAVLVGNIEGPSLFMRTREEIEADCLTALRDRRGDPHFVLGTCMADISFDTPPEKIAVFRETAEAFAASQGEKTR